MVAKLADPAWSPTEIFLGLQATPERIAAIEMLDSIARFQQNGTGFLIPAALLARPIVKKMVHEEVTEASIWGTAPAQTFAESLKQLVRSYSNDRWLSLGEASEVTGQSARTLQRQLSMEQHSYSDIVQQCRQEVAGDLLENSGISIAQIAHQLGYGNQGNFTRAFYRWAKVSPTEFRKHRSLNN